MPTLRKTYTSNAETERDSTKELSQTSGEMVELAKRILSENQSSAVEQFKTTRRLIAWWKPGEGKTRIALMCAEWIRQREGSEEGGIWIAVLRRKAFWDLQNELVKTDTRKNWIIHEFSDQWRTFEGKWQLWMISESMLKKFERFFVLPSLHERVKCIYIDELYLFGNCKSLRSKALRKLVEHCNCPRIGVSGTIMPANDNTSIWGQAWVMCLSTYLAANLTQFRDKYQICRIQDLQRYKIVERINKPGSIRKITDKLSRFVNIYFPKSSRELRIQDTTLPLTSQQVKLIKQIKRDFLYETDNGQIVETRTALEVATRLRQVSSGWLPNPQEPDRPVKIPTNKSIALQQSTEEILAAGEMVLIWVSFRFDIHVVESLFSCPIFRMVGGEEFDAVDFQRKNPQIVVATEGCGSSVNHFKDFQYVKYYSLNYRWLELQQSMARTDRKDGAHNTCHYEFFQLEAPAIDKIVLQAARIAGDSENEFLRLFSKWSST